MMKTIDLTNHRCPVLLLKLKKIVEASIPGDTLLLLASDPHSKDDFTRYCNQKGVDVSVKDSDSGVYEFTLTF